MSPENSSQPPELPESTSTRNRREPPGPENAKPQVKPPFSSSQERGTAPELRELPIVPSSHTLCGNWERPPRNGAL